MLLNLIVVPYLAMWSDYYYSLLLCQCPPCSGDGASCGRKSMICVSGPRMCICDDGYQMDSAGEQCVVNNGVIIPQECAQEKDCSFIPNSHCNNALGVYDVRSHFHSFKTWYFSSNGVGSDLICSPISQSEPTRWPMFIRFQVCRRT